MSEQLGWTAPGFEGVRDAFARNFDEGTEVGAAFSAYHRGQKVVDLWGGIADEAHRPPVGGGLDRPRLLDHQGPDGRLREQARAGGPARRRRPGRAVLARVRRRRARRTCPVSYLLSHQVGLPDVDGKMTLDDVLAWDPVVEALAAQAPLWEPGIAARLPRDHLRLARRRGRAARHGSQHRHVLPRGGRRPARARRVDRPARSRRNRASRTLVGWGSCPTVAIDDSSSTRRRARSIDADHGPRVAARPRADGAGRRAVGTNVWNERAVRAAEIPAAGGVADARSVARLYASCIGEVDGIRHPDARRS